MRNRMVTKKNTDLLSACSKNRGFSLMELMVVVAILGIIAAIALPSYQRYVENTRLTQARSVATQMFQEIQRAKLVNGEFKNAQIAAVETKGANLGKENNLDEYFDFSVVIDADNKAFVNVIPKDANARGLYLDQAGRAFKCTNAADSGSHSAGCEKM